MREKKIVTLVHRTSGETGETFDVTGWSFHNFDKMWDALVRKIDFGVWAPEFSPEVGDDETFEDWLRR